MTVQLILVVEPIEEVARVLRRKFARTQPFLQRTGTRQCVIPVVPGTVGVGAVVVIAIPTLMSVDWPCISVWPRWAGRWGPA